MFEQLKLLLNITDSSKDDLLELAIAQALERVQEYIHHKDIKGIEHIIVQYAAYCYNSGEFEGKGGTGATGELKKEGYSGVTFEYTTQADYAGKSSGSYFDTMIAPYLRPRRIIRCIPVKKPE